MSESNLAVPCPAWGRIALKSEATRPGDDLVPFPKLTMWITYSIIEVFQQVANWRVEGLEDMTGLPEYRNGVHFYRTTRLLIWRVNYAGGLLVDHGVLTLKPDTLPVDSVSGLPSVPS